MSAIKEEDGSQRLHFEVSFNDDSQDGILLWYRKDNLKTGKIKFCLKTFELRIFIYSESDDLSSDQDNGVGLKALQGDTSSW